MLKGKLWFSEQLWVFISLMFRMKVFLVKVIISCEFGEGKFAVEKVVINHFNLAEEFWENFLPKVVEFKRKVCLVSLRKFRFILPRNLELKKKFESFSFAVSKLAFLHSWKLSSTEFCERCFWLLLVNIRTNFEKQKS